MNWVLKAMLFLFIESAVFILSGVELLRELPLFGEGDDHTVPSQPNQNTFPPHARTF